MFDDVTYDELKKIQEKNEEKNLLFAYYEVTIITLAIFINCVVLSAVIRCHLSLPGYRRLLVSLSIGDLYICVVHGLTLAYHLLWLNVKERQNLEAWLSVLRPCAGIVLRDLKLLGFFANLLNLVGMSIDHFVGCVYPVKYQIVSFFLLDFSPSLNEYLLGYASWSCQSCCFGDMDRVFHLSLCRYTGEYPSLRTSRTK